MAHLYSSQLDAFSEYHKHQEAQRSRSTILQGPALPALGHAVSGAVGSAISNVAVYPLDLIITRLQVQRQLRKQSGSEDGDHYYGIWDAIDKIYEREGGLRAFYTGVLQDTGKSILDSFLFFLLYNFLRQRKLRSRIATAKILPVLEELNIGVMAGALAKLVTTPISNVVTRKQTAAMTSTRSLPPQPQNESLRTNKIIKDILNEKGWQGLWSGYSASLVLTLNPSITFFLCEFLKRALLARTQRSNPGPRATFLLAAISKAVASTITYPFSLAKTRAQISSRVPSRARFDVNADLEGKSSKESPDTRTPTQKAKRSTAFSMILEIMRTEGVLGLYDGLSGEVLKGFLSHGITMIVKESVHRFIIQAYYLMLRALRRYPSPAELGENIRDKAQDVSADISQRSQTMAANAADNVTRAASATQEKLSSTAQAGYDATKTTVESTRNKAAEALKQSSQQLQNTARQAQEQAEISANKAYEATQNSFQRATSTINEGKDTATTALQHGSKQVQSIASQAQDQARSSANQAYQTSQDNLQRANSALQESKDQATNTLQNSLENLQSTAHEAQQQAQSTATKAYKTSRDNVQRASSAIESNARSSIDSARQANADVKDKLGQAQSSAEEGYKTDQDPLQRASSAIESGTGSSADAGRRTVGGVRK